MTPDQRPARTADMGERTFAVMWPYASRRRESLTSSLRVFILDYFRTSATEEGHRTAGHGQGMFIAQQRERLEMRASKADCRETREGSNHDPRQARSGPGPAG